MRNIYYPHVKTLIVTPVYGAYDMLQLCVDALEINTHYPYYHVLVDDNFETPILLDATDYRTVISFKCEPPNWEHKEHIVRAMDMGLDYGRRYVGFEYFVKLETDIIVQPDWDKKLIEIGQDITEPWGTLEGVSVDLALDDPEDYVQEQIEQKIQGEPRHYPKEYNEWNCALFSPALMQRPFWFGITSDHHDVLLGAAIKNMGNFQSIETKDVWYEHYRGASRDVMQKINKEKGFE